MIMNKSKKMNTSKKRNMDDYMSQGLLEVEKVMNNSQHFQSIPDDNIGQVQEQVDLQKSLDLKYGQ